MSRKKAAPKLTLAGEPRKRAAGAGRPSMGRTANLPRIKPESHGRLLKLAAHNKMSVAGTLEAAIGYCAEMAGL